MLDLQVGHPSIRVVPGPVNELPAEPAAMVIEEVDLDAWADPELPTRMR
jgi:hypothetical protein